MEANWSLIAFIAFATAIAVYVGRMCFQRWFNPLSLYSAIWGFCLFMYELKLIQYYPVSREAWFYIATAWISLYLGAFTVLVASRQASSRSIPPRPINLRLLKKAIVILSVIGGVAVARQMQVVSREFGGLLTAIFVGGNDIYLAKLDNELAFFPYVGACLYAGCTLSGVYTAAMGRPTVLALAPIVLLALSSALSMTRAGVIMAAFLFLVAFLHSPREHPFRVKKWRAMLGAGAAVALLSGGFILVSATRGLGGSFPGTTPAMQSIEEYIPFFPSVYSNFSATPVALSMYLSTPEEWNTGSWGQYTFAPVLRILSRTRLVRDRPRFEEDYDTPVPTNTSTYLKNLDSDFGFAGIVLFPYILGFAMTLLISGIAQSPKVTSIIVLSNLYLIIIGSFAVNLMVLGDWYISLIVGVIVGVVIDRRRHFFEPMTSPMRNPRIETL
jgi:oligosaccharide repeat unit polymerase